MILEHALLSVSPGTEAEFEKAMEQALPIISGAPGFRSLEVLRCLEQKSTYVLLVRWHTVEDHTRGFRESEQYLEWKRMLHHFYSPFPTVQHFETVHSA